MCEIRDAKCEVRTIMRTRRFARELIIQGLYQFDIAKAPKEEVLDFLISQIKQDNQEICDFIRDDFFGVIEHLNFIDELIRKKSKNWNFGRINKVDKSILRMAIYELFFRADIPDSVTINEAIEIAKKYSTADSSKFVNGILGAIARDEKVSKEPGTGD